MSRNEANGGGYVNSKTMTFAENNISKNNQTEMFMDNMSKDTNLNDQK